jgi:hypothetical protein
MDEFDEHRVLALTETNPAERGDPHRSDQKPAAKKAPDPKGRALVMREK